MDKMYFSDNSGRGQATPLKIEIGEYEISLAGDNSCNKSSVLERLDIRVYKGEEVIEIVYSPDFDDLVKLVEKYRQLSK